MDEKTIQFLQFFPTTLLRCRLPDFERLNTDLLEHIDRLRPKDERVPMLSVGRAAISISLFPLWRPVVFRSPQTGLGDATGIQ